MPYTAFLEIVAIILLIWCAAVAAFWAMVWMRVSAMVKERPTVRAGLNLPEPDDGWPKLSIIVPVHNEQRVIDACARSLLAQTYPNLEIIFVLDRCTDHTRELLRPHEDDPRIVIIENGNCPDDWAGKCNAAHVGAQRASGDWLLFTDADTEFDPELCRAAVALAMNRELSLLSLLSSLTWQARHERIAQPVAAMNLIRLYPLTRTRSNKKLRPFANGQFLLFDRLWYNRIGGHTAVKDDLLEDLAFARLLQRSGGRTAVVMADGMLHCSMYDSLEAFTRGWKRIFIEACRRKPRRLRKNAWRILAVGVATPMVQIGAIALALLMDNALLAAMLLVTVLAGWIIQAATLLRIYRVSGAPASAALAYPIGCWIVGRLMLEGARDLTQRRPVTWGGRQYVLEPRQG